MLGFFLFLFSLLFILGFFYSSKKYSSLLSICVYGTLALFFLPIFFSIDEEGLIALFLLSLFFFLYLSLNSIVGFFFFSKQSFTYFFFSYLLNTIKKLNSLVSFSLIKVSLMLSSLPDYLNLLYIDLVFSYNEFLRFYLNSIRDKYLHFFLSKIISRSKKFSSKRLNK